MLGDIAYSENSVFADFVRRFDVRGRRVLEVGGALPASLVRAAGVASWHAIDPRKPEVDDDNYVVVTGRASVIDLAPDSIDLAFSSNAFEHIHDLAATLSEVARVLAPGGVLYAHFGPIWSGPDGHHLQAECGGEAYDFWDGAAIPHWAHLALDEPALAALLARAFPAATARHLAEVVHRSDWINRLHFADYLSIFADSSLHLRHLGTSSRVDYPYAPPAALGATDELAARARALHPGREIDCREILVVLRKGGV